MTRTAACRTQDCPGPVNLPQDRDGFTLKIIYLPEREENPNRPALEDIVNADSRKSLAAPVLCCDSARPTGSPYTNEESSPAQQLMECCVQA
jgi:hypothetical protein